MHGPGWPAWEPIWTDRLIPVLDTVATSLRPLRRRSWHEARDAALAKWTPSDVTFDITEASADNYPKLDADRLSEPEYLDTLLVPEYLRLMRAPNATRPAFAWALQPWVGAATFYDLQYFWQQTKGYRAYLIGHEVGHCLGLIHQGPTAKSIMSGWMNPDEHDLDSIRVWNYTA